MKDDSEQAAARELSGLTGFAGNRLWRDGERRNGDSLAAALEHPEARIFLTHDGQWLCRTDGAAPDPSCPSVSGSRNACMAMERRPISARSSAGAGAPSIAAASDGRPAGSKPS
ncbi:MAG TPA: NADH pyrophosphatase, partial [Aurantimonas coralicida]|nr:NADH pyrophosphatase [Aurantimonas coralicida]